MSRCVEYSRNACSLAGEAFAERMKELTFEPLNYCFHLCLRIAVYTPRVLVKMQIQKLVSEMP